MNTLKQIVIAICIWAFTLPLYAQSLEVTQVFEAVPYSVVSAQYKNEFGKWEKPLLDDTFPYALIRIGLEGNVREVSAAKQKLGLYMGRMYMPLDKVTDKPNELLFLVPAGAGHIEIQCGDGCKNQVIIDLHRLRSNTIYYGKVHFVPEEEEKNEDVDTEKLKQELKKELLAELLKEQQSTNNNAEQNTTQIVSSSELENQSNIHNDHEYVDLGLSVKWATCNVGATKPEEYGDYFAWGEVKPKSTYNWRTYKWCKGNYQKLTKYNYNLSSFGKVDLKKQLDVSDDAAYVSYGGGWRIPTDSEFNELREKCIWNWTSKNGTNGYLVTSKSNGNSIFLPSPDQNNEMNLYGFYWLRSFNTFFPSQAYIFISSLTMVDIGLTDRCNKCLIRPVCP